MKKLGPYSIPGYYVGDCRALLCALPDESINCVVTSPPYWGLRSYLADGHESKHLELGAERTYQEYVDNMVSVFRDVRRVLRADGTLWLNLGDCYATGAGTVGECPGGGAQGDRWTGNRGDRPGSPKHSGGAMGPTTQPNRLPQPGLKPKDLVGIPWRAAFALQADGWYLRSEIIWHKPNPMPESVTDRPTKSHEQLFLLSKSERYYYDAGAIAEPMIGTTEHDQTGCGQSPPGQTESHGNRRKSGNKERKFGGGIGERPDDDLGKGVPWEDATGKRNRRTVWTIPTEPSSSEVDLDGADYVGADGIPYTASPDCPVHEPLVNRRKLQMDAGDEQLDPGMLRSLGSDCHLAAARLFGRAATSENHSEVTSAGSGSRQIADSVQDNRMQDERYCADDPSVGGESEHHTDRKTKSSKPILGNPDCEDQPCFEIAKSRSTQSCKMVPVPSTSPRDSACEGSVARKHGTSPQLDLADLVGHTDGSSIGRGDSSDRPPDQTHNGIEDMSSFLESICTCRASQRAHFATFPTALVEPCILAGCPAGGIVLDPFGGSGTTGRVAEDLGRQWLLFDLSPEYAKIAKRKTAQTGLLGRCAT